MRLFNNSVKKRKLVDLYCHLSRALYYDVDKGVLVTGAEAQKIYENNKGKTPKALGYLSVEEKIKVDVWNDGKPTLICGTIYEL